MRIIIIGAGAAGCFAGIEIKRIMPEAEVTILEKGNKALAKVAITGGGRCNLTNSFEHIKSLDQVYPRGHRLMKKLFHHFSPNNTYDWFEKQGVRLVTQDDGCVFPQSQDAMEIVNTLLHKLRLAGVRILTGTKVESIVHQNDGKYIIRTDTEEKTADKVLVTTGGHPNKSGYDMLSNIHIQLISPLPSLFSFCLSDDNIKALMGTVVDKATVSIQSTKYHADGALLITHWGVSGPAILKLSSIAACFLAEKNYVSTISIRWISPENDDTSSSRKTSVVDMLKAMAEENRDKQLSSVYPHSLNARLWTHILNRTKLKPDTRWKNLSPKDFFRLENTLTNDVYQMTGKNRFKDEFVTAGGVALNELNPNTLEAKKYPGLFLAGEVTDVDAITGGFNLQAAWTMGYVAAHGIVDAPHN